MTGRLYYPLFCYVLILVPTIPIKNNLIHCKLLLPPGSMVKNGPNILNGLSFFCNKTALQNTESSQLIFDRQGMHQTKRVSYRHLRSILWAFKMGLDLKNRFVYFNWLFWSLVCCSQTFSQSILSSIPILFESIEYRRYF